MLEGLEISEVLLSAIYKIADTHRLDAEFFQRQYLNGDRTLGKLNTKNLLAVTSKIDVGFVGSMTQHYRDEGIPLIQTKNIAEFFVSDSEIVKITRDFHNTLQKSKVKFEDILIARSGSFGKASIFLKTEEINSSDIIIIKANNDVINPYYLTAFLNSNLGVNQMIRFASGGLQGHVNLTILEELKVPLLERDFQKNIEALVKSAAKKLETANFAYVKAEALLLNTLGMADFLPDTGTVNIKSFKDSFAVTGRLDAEYYQPKFDELEAKIAEKHELVSLGSVLTLNQRGAQPDYADEGLPVINSKHVREGEVLLTDNRVANLPDKENSLYIQKGDVLINGTGVGTIGRSAPYLHDQKAIPDNHVTVLRTSKLNPIFLAVYLNSIAGKFQVDKYFKGSSGQIELYPKDIGCFYVPLVDEAIQKRIAEKVQDSFTLKAESERLLAVAKRAVEMAIEQDEFSALEYITLQAPAVH